MPTPIIFTITTAGRVAALDAFDNGLTIALTQCAFGSGKYTPTGSETALNTELGRVGLSGGAIESVSATLRFSAALSASTHINAFEIGLFSSTGVLFAVASTTSTTIPLTVVEPNIDTICAFGMVLGDVPASSLTITLDPNAPLAIQLMNQHVGAENPHPQYAMSADLLAEIETRTAEILALNNDLDDEVFAREAADVALAITISGKADLAGSNSQIFNAANGVSGKNVVNKDQLDVVSAAVVPSGAGMWWPTAVPPTGYLEAAGQSTAGYAALAAIYGATLPDMRGEFIRAWDHGRGVDASRGILTTQTDELKAHVHSIEFTGYDETSATDNHIANGGNTSETTHNFNTESTGGSETRPRNVAWMFIIKT